MRVTYVSPSGSSHYKYARGLHAAGCLHRFISGFSRFSPRAPLPELGDRLLRRDQVQNFFIASLKFRLPSAISDEIAYLSKVWLDHSATRDALQSDLFLCYSGTGLRTFKALKGRPTVGVVEAVNSHVLVQERILREEHALLKIPLSGFLKADVARRVREFELADGVVCPSTFNRRSFLEQGLDPSRVRTVPFGIEVSAQHDPVERPDDVFRVLFVGQINLRKGVRYLLEAFRQFKHPRKELWIVGPQTGQTGIEDITLPEGTRFLGVLKGEALAHAYRSCHVFVLPTIEEGLALVIGEALGHGLPVIATVNSGAEDLFQDGSCGFIVPIRSPEAIAARLQLLAEDRAMLEKLSDQARALGGIRSWDVACAHLVETLKDFARMPKL